MKLLNSLNEYWQNMSRREQRLALIVAVLVLVGGAYTAVMQCIDHVQQLDRTIGVLQDSIIGAASQIAVKESVDAQYRKVASQHSSAWTEAQIHDRLQEEIIGLNQVEPPARNPETGGWVTIAGDSGKLVELPQIGQGTLLEGGQGYRQYSISIRIPTAEFQSLIDFIERLHMSPQSLRVDALDIAREPSRDVVDANVNITRIIVDGSASANLEIAEADAADMEQIGTDLAQWIKKGAVLSQGTDIKGLTPEAVVVQAEAPNAVAHFRTRLESDATYDLMFDAAAEGEGAVVRVLDEDRRQPLSGDVPLKGDGKPYRYHVRFTAPGKKGFPATMGVPAVKMKDPQSRVVIDNLRVRKVEVS